MMVQQQQKLEVPNMRPQPSPTPALPQMLSSLKLACDARHKDNLSFESVGHENEYMDQECMEQISRKSTNYKLALKDYYAKDRDSADSMEVPQAQYHNQPAHMSKEEDKYYLQLGSTNLEGAKSREQFNIDYHGVRRSSKEMDTQAQEQLMKELEGLHQD